MLLLASAAGIGLSAASYHEEAAAQAYDDAAAQAYDDAATDLLGELAVLNFHPKTGEPLYGERLGGPDIVRRGRKRSVPDDSYFSSLATLFSMAVPTSLAANASRTARREAAKCFSVSSGSSPTSFSAWAPKVASLACRETSSS